MDNSLSLEIKRFEFESWTFLIYDFLKLCFQFYCSFICSFVRFVVVVVAVFVLLLLYDFVHNLIILISI